MPSLSPAELETARKGLAFLFQALSDKGGEAAAEALGVSIATVSRLKNDHLEMCCKLAAFLGAKVSDATHECHSPEYLRSLRYFARLGMEAEPPKPKLDFEE